MKKSKGMQLGAMLTAMLIVMATIAVPVGMADTGTPSNAQSTCTTCSAQTAGSDCGCSGGCGSNITAVQLNGSEANKAIADALKDEAVKDIRSELISRGYTPKTSDAIVTYKLADKTTSIDETTIVAIPFKIHDGSQDEVLIVYRKTGESVFVKAMMKKDQIITVLQDGVTYKYGTGSVFIKPIEILVANETYQSLKANSTAQGFTINESGAEVVIDESLNIARIAFIAEGQNSSKINYATVDLNKEIVISIVDPDWWTCLTCCGTCIATGVTLCPCCAGVCLGCVTLIACPLCLACFSACGILLIGSCYCCACECAGVGCP